MMRLQGSILLFVTVILELRSQGVRGQDHSYTYGYDGADSPGKVFCREKYGQNNHIRMGNNTRTKIKVDLLGETLKRHIIQLKKTSNRKLDIIFLVDSSGSVSSRDYENELKFVSKLLSDFTVDRHTTRVAVITFSSKGFVVRGIDHISKPSDDQHKCTLLEEELPWVKTNYTGGSTYTLGALQEAKLVLKHARSDASKAVFLITDGYSNGGNPIPVAREITKSGVQMFTFGIRNGNCVELYDMASEPKREHLYILDSFEEFEALARRALHGDIQVGNYVVQKAERCNSLCSNGDGKGCCDIMASCRCGTHTGKYECICKAGYYGNGLHGSCRECPANTYKNASAPGDESSCVPCPDDQHVSEPGSSSVEHCRCRSGFRSVGEHACAAVTCPPLKPPKNGKFVSECRPPHVMNSACGLNCDVGYKLNGTSLKQCLPDGTWSGGPTTCYLRYCPKLTAPRNGQMLCTKLDFSFETQCKFFCDSGYQIIGSHTRKCLPNSYWSNIPAKCKEITCNKLPRMSLGKIQPPQCYKGKEKPRYGTKCDFSCPAGYRLQGPHSKLCSIAGSWTPSLGKPNSCIDEQPPVVYCPRNMMLETDPNEAAATVNWEVPVKVIDNSLTSVPTTTVVPAMIPPVLLPIGTTTIKYVAEDDSGNKNQCSFQVIVRDTEPPRVDKCISPKPFVKKHGLLTKVHWEDPVFSDNSGKKPTVKQSEKPGSFPLGIRKIVYTAFDDFNNNSTCVITITVKEHACANPPVPFNGNISCEPLHNGIQCFLSCLPGYAFAIPPARSYFCDFDTGRWAPPDKVPFPDCSESTLSNEVLIGATISFKMETSCENRLLLNQVESQFQKQTSNKLLQYCSPLINCSVTGFETNCFAYNDLIENDINVLTNEVEPDLGRNIFRTAALSRKSAALHKKSPKFKLQMDFQMTGSAITSDRVFKRDEQAELKSRFREVIYDLREDAETGVFSQLLPKEEMEYIAMVIDGELPVYQCPQGSVLKNNTCVKCPRGRFFNVITESCKSCEQGTYQDKEGQKTCLVCPQSTSTAQNNSRSKEDCKGLCLPGTMSEKTGVEPCTTCDIGFYQPEYAQTFCRRCPNNTTTWRRGTRHRGECGVMCPEGFVSKTGLQPCFPCPRGYFQPRQGQNRCYLCPGGVKTKDRGSTKRSDCEGLVETSDQLDSIPTTELVVNSCFEEPCQNNATCTYLEAGYTCTCQPGWTGLNCEIDIDECKSSPCKNNGTCTEGLDVFNCTCAPGYTGLYCEIEINECESSPCQNEGSCDDLIDSYTCQCMDGFSGINCEVNIDDCNHQKCLNGATCLDAIGSYSCMCLDGFSGRHCESNIDECESFPCLNGGNCTDGVAQYSCSCVPGFTGERCETDIDECQSDPCQNEAHCQNLVASFFCDCRPSYTGSHCETELDSTFDMTFGDERTNISHVTDYLTTWRTMPNMTEVTVAFWMTTWDSVGSPKYQGTPLSYATDEYDNALTITEYSGFVISINDESLVTDLTATGNVWHHIAVVWTSAGGILKVFKNGNLVQTNDGLADGQFIPGGGYLVVGQEQDIKGGLFSTSETFMGKISRLNIWNRALSNEEIKLLASDCDHLNKIGDIIAWPDLLGDIHGNVKRSDSILCRDCAPLRNISSGWVEHHGLTVGSVTTYHCKPGYDVKGNRNRTCHMAGSWDGKVPKCEKLLCPDPPDIENGRISTWLFEYTYGDEAEVRCNSGYKVSGNKTNLCGMKGQWMGEFPTCEEINCEPPTNLSKNLILEGEKEVYRVRDVLKFSCPHGHMLYGSTTLRCQDDGHWESGFPSCDQVQCYNPPDIRYGEPNAKPDDVFNVGDEVPYQCEEGYNLTSRIKTVTCEPDGTWTTLRPYCTIVKCPSPVLQHGYKIGSIEYKKRMVFSCHSEYKLEGESRGYCLANGTWDIEIPRCVKKTCPEPTRIENGLVRLRDRYIDSTAIYECDQGFTLLGSSTVRCGRNTKWNGQIPSCGKVQCKEPESFKNGQISMETRYYNDTISYSCNSGYNLVGQGERRCGADKEWTPQPPVCEKISCAPPSIIPNSHLTPLSGPYRYQDEVSFTCNDGYIGEGMANYICMANGKWLGARFRCVRYCRTPPPIQYGDYVSNTDKHKVTSLIEVKCQKGYELSGKSTRTCRSDGTWTGPPPNCKRLKCHVPGKLNHGKYILADTSLGAIAQVQCDQGYKVNGPSKRVCSEDKTWSENDPECLKDECPEPSVILHGKVIGDDRIVGSKISYKCEPGYVLKGAFERICAVELEWSDEPPTCELVECDKPTDVISNGRMISFNFSYGATIRYECDPGYILEGSESRRCGEDGLWDEPLPLCEAVNCGRPRRMSNTIIDGFDYRFQRNVTIICRRGYKLIGVANRTCLADGSWSGEPPTCKRIKCERPSPIENGKMKLYGQYFNGRVEYLCDLGFQMVGTRTRSCNANEEWSGQEPNCTKLSCGVPPSVKHAKSVDLNTAVNEFPKYECVIGYHMEEESTVVCGSRGKYSGDGPVCVEIVCSKPLVPDNGQMTFSSDKYNGTVTFTCKGDYKLIGDSVLRCGEQAEWVGKKPFCVRDVCAPPASVFNGTVTTPEGLKIGSYAYYTCDSGFTLMGGLANRICTNDMIWKGEDPYCEAVNCPAPDITNGTITLLGSDEEDISYIYPSVIHISCDDGFVLSGPGESIACTADGNWSSSIPSCIKVVCPTPEIPNSIITQDAPYVYEDVIQIDCDTGYQLLGESELQCMETGLWSDPEPYCDVITCPDPGSFNGKISVIASPNQGYGYPLGIQLGFSCNKGYLLTGSSEIECLANETWSSKPPTCKFQRCPLPDVKPGSPLAGFQVKNYTVGDAIHFFCPLGYDMSGHSSLMCLEGQVWNGTFPECFKVTCYVTTLIPGTYYTTRHVKYGEQVTISCRDGYILHGDPISECLANRTFHPVLASCSPVVCQQGEIENGNFVHRSTPPGFSFGKRLYFYCDKGYELQGENLLACTQHGNWSDPWPTCSLSVCPDIAGEGLIILSEYIEGKPFKKGDQVRLNCDVTHELTDPEAHTLVTCLSSGKWSRELPSCKPKLCHLPNITYSTATINGNTAIISHEQLVVGTFLTVDCGQGYFLEGSPFLICQEDKTWSEDLPKCRHLLCPTFDIENGILSSTNFSYGSVINVVCKLGYELFGDYQMRCLSTGSWSTHTPTCQMIQCPSPAIPYGTFQRSGVNGGAFMFGDSVRFSCEDGFVLKGEPEIVCQPNKTWSATLPACERRICQSPPPKIPRGSIEVISPPGQTKGKNNTFNTKLNFNCDLGYELDRPGTVTCQSDEMWSGDFPNCVKIFCPKPVIKNGYVQPDPSNRRFTFGDSIRFRCDPGFEREGEPEGFCQPNKEWTIEFPTCNRIQCDPPEEIEHGLFIGDSFYYEDWVTYKCDVGYQIEGQNAVKCLASGSWSSLPSCTLVMCPRSQTIPNGNYTVTGHVYKDLVNYQCNEGYILSGNDTRECLGNGSWSGTLPTCNMVHCLIPSNPPHGSYTARSLVYKSVATLVCDLGYNLEGDETISCTGTGNWTAGRGLCVIVSCGPPPIAEHSNVVGLSYFYQSSVTYTCLSGFEIRGISERLCLANGRWSSETPHCDRIQCPPPPSVAHAHRPTNLTRSFAVGGLTRITPPWLYEDGVTYSCMQGYRLLGNEEVSCQADGSWGPGKPQCTRVQCTSPPDLENSNFTTSGREEYMELLLVTCAHGYESTGNRWIECLWDGTWNISGASCDIISCSQPDPVPDGVIQVRTLTYGSEISYRCDEGYELHGPTVRQCNHLKRWSGIEPVCRIRYCPPPENIGNGKVKGSHFEYQSSVTYICDKGYKLKGVEERTCLASLTWSGSVPQCVVVTCPQPGAVSHGEVHVSNLSYASRIHYRCDEGYEVHGDSLRTCAADGTWTGRQPRCEKVRCPLPNAISHGTYSGSQLTYGSTITYSCDNHYEIVGAATRRCQADKTWSGSMPACIIKTCKEKPLLLNGAIQGTNFSAGASIQFLCDKGYSLAGQSSITCVAGDHWSHSFPKCEKVSCGLPKLIENSYTDGNSYEYQDRVRYRCKVGYIIAGDDWVECRADGKWSDVLAKCEPISCGLPPNVYAASVHGDSYVLHDFVYYTCKQGYELSGNNLLQCGPDGQWLGEKPTCAMVICGDVPVIRYSTTTLTRHQFGSRAIYECNIGYVLEGSAEVECDSDGHWSFMGPRPECRPVDCGLPPAISNGQALAENTTYRSVAMYRCNDGYNLRGGTMMECRHDQVWEGQIPRCVPLVCVKPAPPNHGRVRGLVFTYRSTVTFECQSGYRLIGSAQRTCQANRTWSGITPECTVVLCQQPDSLVNGDVSVKSLQYNSRIYYYCNPGYRLEGQSSAVCQETGLWSSQTPICREERVYCPPLPPPVNTAPVSGSYSPGESVQIQCVPGYRPAGDMHISCTRHLTWTTFTGSCTRVFCGRPKSSHLVVLMGSSFYYGDELTYGCKRGLRPSASRKLKCQADGQWDNVPSCSAKCKFTCANGGTCVGRNKCKCKNGWGGRWCKQAACMLPCMNGGHCSEPYTCSCQPGYTGTRCQTPTCSGGCKNGGTCYMPNRCICPHGYKPPFCDESLNREKQNQVLLLPPV